MRKKLLSILVLSILVASTSVGCAPSTLTILSMSEGSVSIMKAGTDSWTEAEVGMSLSPGDSIRTGDNSAAEITFFDGSTMELEAGTKIEIASLDISRDTDSVTITVEQTIGSIIFRVTKIVDPASRHEVETPAGVVAVRGSAMQVYVMEDGTTWITNLEGDIWAAAQGVQLQIPEGQRCIIELGQRPELVYSDEIGPGLWRLSVTGEGIEATVTEQGVVVNITSNPVDDPDTEAFGVRGWSTYALEGDFDIRMGYELTTWAQGSGVRIGLCAWTSGIPYGSVTVERVGFGDPDLDFPGYPREVYLVDSAQGCYGITGTDDLSGTLRIRREGEIVNCYYGTSDGWYEIYEAEWPTEDAWVSVNTWCDESGFGGEEVSLLMRTIEIYEPPP